MQELDDSDDDDDFFGMILPTLINEYKKLSSNKRKREMLRSTERTGRRGKKGRRWQQRKRGDMKPEDFTWFRLIHHADVSDLTSAKGKVTY